MIYLSLISHELINQGSMCFSCFHGSDKTLNSYMGLARLWTSIDLTGSTKRASNGSYGLDPWILSCDGWNMCVARGWGFDSYQPHCYYAIFV